MNEELAADVLVVGGGVIGCSIAYHLSKSGARVTLVERGRIGREASWATAGIISPPHSPATRPERATLERRSFNAYPGLVMELAEATGHSVEWRPSGELTVAMDEEHVAPLRETARWQRDQGFEAEWLEGDAARMVEPGLAPSTLGAVLTPAAASLRGHRFTATLAAAARRHGATIVEAAPVWALLREGDRLGGVRTQVGDFHAGQVVIATGAWTGLLGGLLESVVPVHPVPGQMLAVTGAARPLRRIIAGAGGYLVPRADGALAVGATVDEPSFDARVTPHGLTWLVGLLERLAPEYAGARVIATWAGLRPASADGQPLLGRATGWRNVWVAAGHFRSGILWAPITGELLASSILAGEPAPELAPFDPARFTVAATLTAGC